MSYAAKAANLLGHPAAEVPPAGPRTRLDFLSALRILGGRFGPRIEPLWGSDHDVLFVMLQCAGDTWRAVFGDFELVARPNDPFSSQLCSAWRHECADGPLTCLGHVFQLSDGSQRISLSRIAFD